MLGVYDYTVILTYLSAVSSLTGMGLALSGHTGLAILCLVAAGICDMFDGQVARTKKNRTEEEKKFGIQIDSLCDLISFGVFPAVIGYSLKPDFGFEKLVFVLFPLAGLIRLAYYNVQEEARQKETTEKRKYFTGIPITSSAIVFPFLYLMKALLTDGVFYIIYTAVSAVVLCLFVARIRVPKPERPARFLAILAVFAVILIGLVLLLK